MSKQFTCVNVCVNIEQEVLAGTPSINQLQLLAPGVVLVNVLVTGTQPELISTLKLMIGSGFTVMFVVLVLPQFPAMV